MDRPMTVLQWSELLGQDKPPKYAALKKCSTPNCSGKVPNRKIQNVERT